MKVGSKAAIYESLKEGFVSTKVVLCVLATLVAHVSFAQSGNDTLNITRIRNLALKGQVTDVLKMLDTLDLYRAEDIQFRTKFEQRFKYKSDRSNSLDSVPKELRPLLTFYRDYWRMCLLDNSKINDSIFRVSAVKFYLKENAKSMFTDKLISVGNLENISKDYIVRMGYRSNDFGRTGFLYDLLVWKGVQPEMYTVPLVDDSVVVRVNFVREFISLGWLGYARIGRGPGGWATKEELFCVSDLYPDLSAERFLISYLKHEGQHFSDFERFPHLPSNDLEYRAKLIEVRFSEHQLVSLLSSFIEGAKNDVTNAHPFSNYCVIRDLSRLIFGSEFEHEIKQWEKVDRGMIRSAANQLYKESNSRIAVGMFLRGD